MTAVTVKELKEILATTKAPQKLCDPVTGKSFSEALILASVNPHYDKRLFIEFPRKIQVQNKLCTKIVSLCTNNICTQHVQNLYFFGEFI